MPEPWVLHNIGYCSFQLYEDSQHTYTDEVRKEVIVFDSYKLSKSSQNPSEQLSAEERKANIIKDMMLQEAKNQSNSCV